MDSDFLEMFAMFRQKFPPASGIDQARLRLTTGDLVEMFSGFNPGLKLETADLFSLMKQHGYRYEPLEYNEQVKFYWLIGESEKTP